MASDLITMKLMQTHMNANAGGLDVVYDNVKYTPQSGINWQRVDFLWAEPENPTLGEGYHRDVGIMQVTLHFKLHEGVGNATARSEAIKAAFKRGTTFHEGSQRVMINRTPRHFILPKDESWFRVAVSVPFFVDVYQ